MTENVTKLHDNTDKFHFTNSSSQLMSVSSGFLLLLGLLFDIAAIVLTIFHVNKCVRIDQATALLKMLRHEAQMNQIIPSWQPKKAELPKEQKDFISSTELSSETYEPYVASMPNYFKTSRWTRRHFSSSLVSKDSQISPIIHEFQKTHHSRCSSTNGCNVRGDNIQRLRLESSRASSSNYQGSSIRSFAHKYQTYMNPYENSFLQKQKRLRKMKNVPDAIKLWFSELEEDHSTGLKTTNSNINYSKNSDNRRTTKRPLLPNNKYRQPLHQHFRDSNATGGAGVGSFHSDKDPLGIEKLNSHDKVKNYLSDLRLDRNTPIQKPAERRTLKSSRILSNSCYDMERSELNRRRINADRLSDFECRSTSVSDTFSNLGEVSKSFCKNRHRIVASTPKFNLSNSVADVTETPKQTFHFQGLETEADYENISMTDTQSLLAPVNHGAPSMSDLTNVSIETDFNLNLQSPGKHLMAANMRARGGRTSAIPEESDHAVIHELCTTHEVTVTKNTETLSSGTLPTRAPTVLKFEALPEHEREYFEKESSSDSLSSASSDKNDGSLEKFAWETNTLWQKMTKESNTNQKK